MNRPDAELTPDAGLAHGPELLEARLQRQIDALEHRFEALKRVRNLAIGAAFSAILVAAAALSVWAAGRPLAPVAETLRARQLLLVDGEGRTRGTWGLDSLGTARLAIHDADGIARLRFSVLDSGAPGLALADERGAARTVLGVLPDETTNLVFADRRGGTRIVLGLTPDERATLVFSDSQGEVLRAFGFGVEEPSDAGEPADPGEPAVPGDADASDTNPGNADLDDADNPADALRESGQNATPLGGPDPSGRK